METHSPYSIPEDGSSMYLLNASNTAHINMVQRPKSRININNEPREHGISYWGDVCTFCLQEY
jgi:hypothetical protein